MIRKNSNQGTVKSCETKQAGIGINTTNSELKNDIPITKRNIRNVTYIDTSEWTGYKTKENQFKIS